MARKRFKFGAIAPIDTLTNDNTKTDLSSPHLIGKSTVKQAKAHTEVAKISKRYKEFRRDPGVVKELDQLSSKDFLFTLKEDKPKTPIVAKSNITLTGSVVVINSGTGTSISKLYDYKCILKLIDDFDGLRCQFFHKTLPIDELQIHLDKDCKEIYFEETNSAIGFLLNSPRKIKIQNDHLTDMTSFMWITNPANEGKQMVLRRSIATSANLTQKIKKYSTKNELKTNLLSPPRPRNTNTLPFWNKGFRSLEFHKKTPSKVLQVNNNNAISINAYNKKIGAKIKIDKKEDKVTAKNENTSINRLHITDEPRPSRMKTRSQGNAYDDLEVYFTPDLFHKFSDNSYYTITNQDFRSLNEGNWLNDTIIDFFIRYYMDQTVKFKDQSQFYIASSFFYTKLSESDSENCYASVKKWVENVNFFEKEYIVIPINSNFHWFGCIVAGMPEYFEKAKENLDVTDLSTLPLIEILTFDSLKQTHQKKLDVIKNFIILYAKDKFSLDIDRASIKVRNCMVPRQPNLCDCGVHVIYNFKKFFEAPLEVTEFWEINKPKGGSSFKTVNLFFDKNIRTSARESMRNILLHLQNLQKVEQCHERKNDICDESDNEDLLIIEDPQKLLQAEKSSKENANVINANNAVDDTI